MTYTPTTWVDGTAPAITAANLNKIEDGIYDAHEMIRRYIFFEFQVNNTQVISGVFSTIVGKEISVDWGDGGARSTYSGTDQAYSKDYGSANNRTVRIFGSVVLTKFTMSQDLADISFDLADLPAGLTYLLVVGANTISGDLAGIPAGLTYFQCIGSNTISGDLASLSSGLTVFSICGVNTVSGDLADLPAGLTAYSCSGQNTVSGDLADLPAGLTGFLAGGVNTIADYTGKTWTTKMEAVILTPSPPGGLSEAEVDQLLIDLDADMVWTSIDLISLTGTNAPRSAASDAAVASIQAQGATVITN